MTGKNGKVSKIAAGTNEKEAVTGGRFGRSREAAYIVKAVENR